MIAGNKSSRGQLKNICHTSSALLEHLPGTLTVLILIYWVRIYTVVKTALVESRLAWREQRISAGGIARYLKFIQLFINITLVLGLLLLKSLRHEFAHQRAHPFAHRTASNFVCSRLGLINYLCFLFLGECSFGFKNTLFFLLFVYFFKSFEFLHDISQKISCTFRRFFFLRFGLLFAILTSLLFLYIARLATSINIWVWAWWDLWTWLSVSSRVIYFGRMVNRASLRLTN